MGCDIHLFVETKDSSGVWQPVKVLTDCSWCNSTGKDRAGAACYWCKGTKREAGYHNRNYDTFAILANVRNGSGFAGIKTGSGFNSISEPRGLPEDLSRELRRIADGPNAWERLADENESLNEVEKSERAYDFYKDKYGCGWLGDHSYSHVTLKELIEYDWGQTTTHEGVVGPKELKKWLETGKPESWSGGVSGKSVSHVSNEAMRILVEEATFSSSGLFGETLTFIPEETAKKLESNYGCRFVGTVKSFYTSVQWEETYRESVGSFYSKFLPALKEVGDPDKVRLVFGFDS